ncbi:neural-cadherin [Elysia marginata]|uniref:Neural-cadherin n=1 Tax=Elysia marginata TaxID=1093978 RepID=A0AAV4JV24_9GAST|nr:neural-cadherin [Elysia marginata]
MTNPSPYQAVVDANAPPGTVIYTVSAADADLNSQLEFSIGSASGQRFDIQASSGNTANIVTKGTSPFTGSQIEIQVNIEDKGANPIQKLTKTVTVTVGTLPPQFYLSTYEAQIYEGSAQQIVQTKDESASLLIKVIKFQPDNDLTFEVSDERFEIISDPAQPNQISLRSKEAFDYETTQSVTLLVRVTESNTNYQSDVRVKVHVIDENDSTPRFIGKSQYFEEVSENANVGTSVFIVSATDADSGANGEIVFSIEGTDAFEVTTKNTDGVYVGTVEVKNQNKLDYEKLEGNNVRAIQFSIIATDGNTVSPKSSSVLASVTVNNINDNDPTIDNSSLKITAPSSSKRDDIVSILGASDLDGDNIRFSFSGGSANSASGFFTIEAESGKLSWAQDMPPDQDTFELNIVTFDDGACCVPRISRTSTTQVVITVEDANNFKPDFQQCNEYNKEEVSEDAVAGASVVMVSATDGDRGENKKVTYSLKDESTSPLKIDRDSGLITVEEPNKIVRERGRDPYIQVTVIGENSDSKVKLKGYCTFRVNIIDVNDHPPTFDKTRYDVSFLLSSALPATITRVQATDGDFGKNANITYSLGSSAPVFFSIDRLSGSVILQKNDDIRPTLYSFTVIAYDNGGEKPRLNGTTTLNVDVKAGAFELPRWIQPPPQYTLTIPVDENKDIGTTLTTLRCESQSPSNPKVEFIVFDTTKTINDVSEFFSATTVAPGAGSTIYSMELKLKKNLDYLVQKEHFVTATCSGFTSGNLRAPDIVIRINVIDTNNQPPLLEGMESFGRFQASVPENSPPGTSVRTVQVNDKDENPQFKDVTFKLQDIDYELFTIKKVNDFEAVVETAKEFDREKKFTYNFQIVASDGTNTDGRYMVVTVTDVNDQVPEFAKLRYEFNVSETADINYQIGEVTATDRDEIDQNLEYQFTSGNVNSAFTILSGTGEIRLVRKLDFESQSEPKIYTLTLTAYDNGRIHSNTTTVIIHVLDENDNPPIFTQPEYVVRGSVEEEDENNTPAQPKYLTTVKATDKDTERDQTKITYSLASASELFQVNTISGEVFLIGELDRDGPVPETRVTIMAADEPINPLYAYADVVVFPTDINDNKPRFDLDQISFTVEEHARSGTYVGTVLARDIDEGQNKEVRYQMNPYSPTQRANYFRLTDRGRISTNVDRDLLDFENFTSVEINVEAYDLGIPSQNNSQTITIALRDINDQKPYFEQNLYITRMSEATTSGEILRLEAKDADTDPRNRAFQFEIDPPAENFLVEANGDYAVISVNQDNPIDYEEDPHEFRFTLKVNDGGTAPDHTASTSVVITVEDFNDNPPVFDQKLIQDTLAEGDPKGAYIATFSATDKDSGINSEIEYSVQQDSDPFFEFYIDPSNGNVTTRKVLDRELADTRTVIILATDKAAAGGNGSATIRTSTRFDREQRKEYFLPIVIWDMNGQNSADSLTATSTLTIVIGDKNDNKHSPGHQEITFNNFDGKFGDVEIGRVYAEDADDWDLPDKTFTFVSPEIYKNYFSVDAESGIITIKKGVPGTKKDEPYEFKVDVYDKTFKNTETCTVAVHVKDLPDEALKKAGSVRLTGISAEEFIAPGGPSKPGIEPPPSKMQKFRAEMARLLQYPGPDNIEIVGLTDGPNYLDVRFSGHASPYLSPSQMESTLMLNADSIQKAAGIKIGQVPINLCMEEKFSVGCYTDVEASASPLVIDANGQSLTTVDLSSEAKDGCPSKDFPEPVVCSGEYCYNGGTCRQDDWNKLSCQCPKGFDGPRCQQRRHSFDGNSIAFYKGLSACTEGRTSIEFITLEPDGLIMFSGPVIDIDPNNSPQDFMILELKNGYPQLRLNLGVGEVALLLDGLNEQNDVKMPALNDGQWHRIDIDRDFQDVTLTVDHCNYATADADGTVLDWSPCRAHGRVPGGDVLLNVQSLLQLGGRYPRVSPPSFPAGVPTKGFKGCLKNLFHNSILYDLYYKPILNWNSGQNGCPREESICKESDPVPFCGVKATCQSQWDGEAVQSCTCHPGWYGDKCSTGTPIMDLGDKSFLQWELSANTIQDAEHIASFQLMFRSRELTGTLFAITNAAQNKIDLELEDSRLVLRYNLGQGERMLKLANASASDGAWHVARVERYGSELQLTLDAGEGRTYTYRPLVENVDVLFKSLPFISAGGRVPTMASPSVNQISNDLVSSCIQDVRFNGIWLPMTPSQNSQAGPGVELLSAPNVDEGCSRNDCYQITCSDDRFCYPLWGAHECRCLAGSRQAANGQCVSACEPNPCFNNAPCSIVNEAVKCECPPDFTGQFCNIGLISEEDDGLSAGIIAGIVIAIIALLILVILIILFITCRRDDSEKNILEVDPDDDFIRENVMYYDEEGAGEEDHEAYDITLLQKMNSETANMPHMNAPKESDMVRRNEPRLDRPDVGSFIDSRIRDTENDDDPFKDVPMEFNYEGGNSDAGSLSSLNTSSSGGSQDYDYLNDWGPKFARLADMYGAGQNLEA